ncbi:hypothetical protein N7451_012076 [Penicillium sp. IBT 35674x]|nr:hypothetical protein N7451_012076 [Penicillium sp. IBT 35674x]
MNYHLDDRTLPARAVPNPFVLSAKPLSDSLLQVYLDRVRISMPLIRRDLFCDQHRHCYIRGSVNPGRKWLAIFNLVLAIGYENIFFARAKSLCSQESILYEHADLQQVQTISQINRSWKMIAIAARPGISLGLNLQRKNDSFDKKSRETRKQVWWSIFRLEHILSVMTGRDSCVGSSSRTLAPPLPFPTLVHAGIDTHRNLEKSAAQFHNL